MAPAVEPAVGPLFMSALIVSRRTKNRLLLQLLMRACCAHGALTMQMLRLRRSYQADPSDKRKKIPRE